MIPDFKTYIKESAWGDMMRRGSGEEIRKEDDINLLDMVGLYEYILSHYELTDNRYELTYGTANMCIPISIKGEEILLTYKFDEVHCYFNLNVYPKLYSLLQKKFNVEEMSDDDIGEHYIISPKDECTNQFYIDVIDCIIENRNTIVRKKELNESAWGDMMRRGSGEDIRKEDIINSNEDLRNKIRKLYREQGEGDILDVSSLSEMIACDDFSNLFYDFDHVKQIIGLDTWDVSKVTNMGDMFANCYYLTELNISNWNVSKVTNMRSMFFKCSSLKELNINNWDVSKVTDMNSMFYGCGHLIEFNISNWDVSNVIDMCYMFAYCRSLTDLNISNWNLSNDTDMTHMFNKCYKLIKPKWYNE